jgi:hypothetical protein
MAGKWAIPFVAQSPVVPPPTWTVGPTKGKVTSLVDSGDPAYAARLKLAEEVVGAPTCIYKGWDRQNKHNCWIYCGFPKVDYRRAGDRTKGAITTDPPKNAAFLVFVTDEGAVDDWKWRELLDGDRPQGINGDITWPS